MTPDSSRRFRELFFAHAADLRAFVAVLVGSRGARDDVVMEVAQALWMHFATHDPGRPFGQWARSVAANKILQHQRVNPAYPARLSPEATLAVAEAWDDAERNGGVCARNEELRALEACLQGLPERATRLIRLHYQESQPVAAIAGPSQSTPEGLFQSLGRLRQKLAACVRARLSGPNPPAPASPAGSSA